MNTKPTYFEMSNFDTPPNSLVRLGQIIHDFKNPADVVAPPPAYPPLQHVPEVVTSVQKDWQSTKSKLSNGSVGVWTQFLASILGIGADASLLLEREKGNVLKFEELETRYIQPDLEYVRAAMASPQAVRFYQERPYTTAYIVTGIKIARGAAIERLRRLKYGVEGSVGVDLTSITGAPVTLGPQASFIRESSTSTTFSGSSDFVFAYRLRKINKRRSHVVTGSKDYVRGAVHNLDEGGATEPIHVPNMSTKEDLTAFVIMSVDEEDFGDEVLYGSYREVDVIDNIDDSKDEAGRVLVKNT